MGSLSAKYLDIMVVAIYVDFDSTLRMACDPGCDFKMGCKLNVESGNDTRIEYFDDIILSTKIVPTQTFSGYIQRIQLLNDEDTPPNHYYELFPDQRRGTQSLPKGARLIISQKSTKVIHPTKPIVLEYRKGPCRNFYEVI